ncbi:secreted RxLR effector protein 161-like [Dioscorea cayenensis subsp. rotundata]|uniref:Secreted RxLR effector protein 161-like n=1 Tax=Dioscorea cayennensis subsp. rotundata TaxID=55577 RepID=A0AB40C4A9_DIOCR|nr:secreted RxLR effector protein 161-like [Dioscorea cayenensis subsp. rotundata]
MENCSPSVAPIMRGDKFNLDQCPKNNLEKEQMENIPYASAVRSLMYAFGACRDPGHYISLWGCLEDIKVIQGFTFGKLQKVIKYLEGTKEYKLTYRRSDNLEVIRYSDSDYVGCLDSRRSASGYIFMLAVVLSMEECKAGLWFATSTIEAGFVSCFEGVRVFGWGVSYSGLRISDSISKAIKDVL